VGWNSQSFVAHGRVVAAIVSVVAVLADLAFVQV